MNCKPPISRRPATSLPAAPNHKFRNLPDLLFLHEIISRRINTYKIPKKSRISLIRINLKSTRINTSGNKGLKSSRINTSGNKDLKSRRINTSKKRGRGVWKSVCRVRALLEVRRQPFVLRLPAGRQAPCASAAAAIDSAARAPYPESEASTKPPRAMDIFEEIVRLRRAGQRAALATIVHTDGSIPSYESSRMLVREDGSIAGTIGGGCVEAEVWAAAKEVMRAESPRKMTFNLNHEADYDNGLICGGTLEIFVEPILPQPELVIFGGGHVSIALGHAAHAAGFAISVVDDREAFANAERFPMAHRILTTYEDAFASLKPGASTYVVIITRGHRDDLRVLEWAVETDARYVGMIGSRRKVLSVYRALEEKAGIPPERFERVYAPIGLAIGALTPEEIAVSIAAELIAVRRGVASAAHKSIRHILATPAAANSPASDD
jgi:xanthine dehydrogenase accessory factor